MFRVSDYKRKRDEVVSEVILAHDPEIAQAFDSPAEHPPITFQLVLFKRKYPIPVLLHANDRPAAFGGFVEGAVEFACD